MRRLSIIDLDSGNQPLFNEDKSLILVFNGEIYNYQVLRAKLISLGHTFTTNSDSEVDVYKRQPPSYYKGLRELYT